MSAVDLVKLIWLADLVKRGVGIRGTIEKPNLIHYG
jgi:hypothetical protein